MSRFYAGIGSRETPVEIQQIMRHLAGGLSKLGFTCRTGRADGADHAFASGSTNTELYLPWQSYNIEHMSFYEGASVILPGPTAAAVAMAERSTEPAHWSRCKQGARKMHGRNCHIILGSMLDIPSEMVICWTVGGLRGGGTGMGCRIADAINIPIFDLAIEENIAILRNWLNI